MAPTKYPAADCAVCGTRFIPKHPKRLYCSATCRKKAENQRAHARRIAADGSEIEVAFNPAFDRPEKLTNPMESTIEILTGDRPGDRPKTFKVKMEQDWARKMPEILKVEPNTAFDRLLCKYHVFSLSRSNDPLEMITFYQEVLDCDELTQEEKDFITERIRNLK